jgi:[histone H3]-trimethyl-L-lysine9/36 demethylase
MMPPAPVRRPSPEQFRHFNRYVLTELETDPEVRRAGFVKVVPPEGFRAEHDIPPEDYSRRLARLHIEAPIRQLAQTVAQGVWRVSHLVDQEHVPANRFIESASRADKAAKKRMNAEEGGELDTIKQAFWKKIDSASAPLYGADCPGSLFDPQNKGSWNMNHLRSRLDIVGTAMSGVNRPYLYFGQQRSMFPWHTEDMDLHSINLIHFGQPKQWYVVPPSQKDAMYEIGRKYLPKEFKRCPEFFRHKCLMIDPNILVKHGIEVMECTQYESEIVITFAGCFHAGFNYGANCAESVNFATEAWIEHGKTSGVCVCSRESVYINMEEFERDSTAVELCRS